MTTSLRRELYESSVGLGPRPASVPTLLLTSWRVPVVLLLIKACRQEKAKREQLVVLNWSLRDSATHEAVREWLMKEPLREAPAVRYEPALVRATNIAHGLGLLHEVSGWLELTKQGSELLSEIEELDAYASERQLLEQLPKPLSHSAAKALLGGGVA